MRARAIDRMDRRRAGQWVMLGQMLVAMLTAAREQSRTVDEPVYVGAAISYLEQHSLQLDAEHPRLAKFVSAVGLGFADARLDPTYRGSQWNIGGEASTHGGTTATGFCSSRECRSSCGRCRSASLLRLRVRTCSGTAERRSSARLLDTFSPDVIAHGSLATNDVAVAGFLLTTMWLLWRSHLG